MKIRKGLTLIYSARTNDPESFENNRSFMSERTNEELQEKIEKLKTQGLYFMVHQYVIYLKVLREECLKRGIECPICVSQDGVLVWVEVDAPIEQHPN